MKIFTIIVASLAFTVLPIWRAAPDKRGLNFWEYLSWTASDEYQATHIPYKHALDKAREVYGAE